MQNQKTQRQLERYFYKLKSYDKLRVWEEHVLTCGSVGNITQRRVYCYQQSGRTKPLRYLLAMMTYQTLVSFLFQKYEYSFHTG